MCDICKWSTMHKCRCMLQCLHKVRLQSILEEGSHSAFCVKVTGCYRLLLGNLAICVADNDACKALLEVSDVACEAENCHDLGCDCDIIAILTRCAVDASAETVDDESELAVIHVHAALPCDLSRVDVQLISLIDMVVDHGCEQVVGCADCVEVTCEVKVDVFHRDDLCVSAACSTALDAEDRAEGRLTESDDDVLAKLLHSVCETYSCSCLALTCRCRVDSCYQDELAVRTVYFLQNVIINLCLILAILLEIFVVYARDLSDLSDGHHL